MTFIGTEGESITLAQAAEMTENYRDENPKGLKAHFLGKDIIKDILRQANCVGIRIYYGIDANNVQQLILVGADGEENDQTSGIIADVSKLCPPFCGEANDLNGN